MRLQLTRAAPAALVLVVVLGAAIVALADESTGTWTGHLEGVGNYYWERSTRVIVPTIGAEVVAPNGIAVGADYLVDVISSASIAQTGGGDDAVFTELRHGVGLHVGKEFLAGGAPLDLRAHATYSFEDDYKSWIYGLEGALSLNDRMSVVRLSATRLDDTIESNADPTREEELGGITLGTSWEQVLSRVIVLTTGYQIGYLYGFTGNIYRKANVGPLPIAEDHPDTRWRHTAEMRLRWYIPETGTALHLMPRAHLDSWDVRAVNPEARVVQELGTPDVLVRLRYRFYAQSAAEFAPDVVARRLGATQPGPGEYPGAYLEPDTRARALGPVTGDPKLTEFQTHYAGIKFDFHLTFLDESFLAFASDGWLYVNFDRIWNDNAYGNGVIAQVGGILPF